MLYCKPSMNPSLTLFTGVKFQFFSNNYNGQLYPFHFNSLSITSLAFSLYHSTTQRYFVTGFANLLVDDKLVLTRHGVFRSLLGIVGLWYDEPGPYYFFTIKGDTPIAERIERMLPELRVTYFCYTFEI